jgi:hypothetical protein
MMAVRVSGETLGKAARQWRVIRLAVAAVLATSAVLAAAPAASASPGLAEGWQPQEAPVPAGALATGLNTVSCGSATACMTVGNYEGSGSTFDAFAESWNGSAWSIVSVPDAASSYLSGVSCISASACISVGDVNSGGTLVTLAESWNGTTWTVQATPNPARATASYLTSVSCTSSTACMAVGLYENPAGHDLSLAEAWNGSTWELRSTPNPSGTKTTEFQTVSCASASACAAVGYYLSPSYTALGEIWNGTSWTLENPSLPAGGTDGYLSGVSCSSAHACTAVGDYTSGTDVVTLAERWNGTAWTVQATRNRVSAVESYLESVDCVSATACTSVGTEHHPTGPVKLITLAERWNGTTWHLSAPGAPSGAIESALSGLSCPSRTECMGVGYYENSEGTELPLVDLFD